MEGNNRNEVSFKLPYSLLLNHCLCLLSSNKRLVTLFNFARTSHLEVESSSGIQTVDIAKNSTIGGC